MSPWVSQLPVTPHSGEEWTEQFATGNQGARQQVTVDTILFQMEKVSVWLKPFPDCPSGLFLCRLCSQREHYMCPLDHFTTSLLLLFSTPLGQSLPLVDLSVAVITPRPLCSSVALGASQWAWGEEKQLYGVYVTPD